MKDIAVYGAGGFGRGIVDMIRHINKLNNEDWNFIGFFDDGVIEDCEYGPILGNIQVLNQWNSELAIVISIGNPLLLKKIHNQINNKNVYFPNLIAPNVVLLNETNLNIGQGNIMFFGSFIGNNVTVGDFNIFNLNSALGHDVTMGSYNVLMPVVNISGGVTIGDSNLFGVKSSVIQYLKIGNRSTIGTGSVIIRKVQDDSLYMGNPAKRIDL